DEHTVLIEGRPDAVADRAAEWGDRAHPAAEHVHGTRHVERLAARERDLPGGAVDGTRFERVDAVGHIERRGEPEAGDHGRRSAAIRASTSARVAWPPVPPAARVESDPATAAQRTASSSESPSSHAARNPASKLSPAPVVSTTSSTSPAARTTAPSGRTAK